LALTVQLSTVAVGKRRRQLYFVLTSSKHSLQKRKKTHTHTHTHTHTPHRILGKFVPCGTLFRYKSPSRGNIFEAALLLSSRLIDDAVRDLHSTQLLDSVQNLARFPIHSQKIDEPTTESEWKPLCSNYPDLSVLAGSDPQKRDVAKTELADAISKKVAYLDTNKFDRRGFPFTQLVKVLEAFLFIAHMKERPRSSFVVRHIAIIYGPDCLFKEWVYDEPVCDIVMRLLRLISDAIASVQLGFIALRRIFFLLDLVVRLPWVFEEALKIMKSHKHENISKHAP